MVENYSRIKKTLYLSSLIIFLASCARVEYFPPEKVQTGLASWYGPGFHGKMTSSREIYNMYDMTAAHRTLPFGAYVMVTNLKNGKSTIVKINDRGPFIKGRIIDLSYAAAQMLDIVEEGVVPVKIEVLRDVSPKKSGQKFSVQLGAFIFKKNALALKKKLQKKYEGVFISIYETPYQTYYRVRIKAGSLEAAQKIGRKLLKDGYTVLLIEGQ